MPGSSDFLGGQVVSLPASAPSRAGLPVARVWRVSPAATAPAPAPRPYRDLAAHLLEGQVARLGRAGMVVERRLARGLRMLCEGRRYRDLGFVRLGDFLTERLGMSLRRCQSLLRADRVMSECPALARAFDAGDLAPSRLEAIAGVVTPGTEQSWLARALRLPVRRLEEEARTARMMAGAGAAGGEALPGGVAASPAGMAGAQDGAPAGPAPAESEEPDTIVSFPCPGRVVGLWHWSLDLIRRVAGRQEPAWRCAEYLAAEFLAGVPAPPPRGGPLLPAHGSAGAERGAAGPAAERGESFPGEASAGDHGSSWDVGVWLEATAAVRDALQRLGSAADPEGILSGRVADPTAAGSGREIDPWRLDELLRALVRLRQSLAWRQGRLLEVLARHSLHAELGFPAFDDWCSDAAGMSPRRARYLVSLDRRLRGLPHLADAYRRGAVSWCQARLLVRVARPRTERRWIRFVRRVTVRRLEEAVIASEISAAAAGEGGLPGSIEPLPPDDRQADRHTSARPEPGPEAEAGGPSGGRLTARITFAAPAAVAILWEQAVAACRAVEGADLAEWECLERFIRSLRDAWENPDDPGWRRRYRIFERDGWRCAVPGCTSRGNLNEHHIVFRSRGGGDEDRNLITLCVGHHQQGVHRGRIRCAGQAPDAVAWELGVRPGGPPLARYSGDRLLGSWRAL